MSVEWQGSDVRLRPAGRMAGTVVVPGSKSLTNRYLICAALADGTTTLRGASLSDDAHALLGGLEALGVRMDVLSDAREIIVHGCRGNLPHDEAALNVGNAGTAMRFLTALVCLGHGEYRLDGSARMRARPIGPLVEALQQLGARIEYTGTDGCPPLRIAASGLHGHELGFATPPSSQYISALLMVAPYARGDVMIAIDGDVTSRPYLALTCDVMRDMGVELLERDWRRFVVPAYQRYQPGTYDVEPDASAATYIWAAAALTGGRGGVRGITRTSRQGDARFVDVLTQMGCTVAEEAGTLVVAAPADGRLHGVDVDLNEMPDTVQTLAVLALFADGPTNVRNVANLRIKETDRIAALSQELAKLGAQVEARADGLTIHPPRQLTPASIDTYDDHRMAMSFAIAGLVVDGVVIRDAGCVSKSFPDFFDVLATLPTAS